MPPSLSIVALIARANPLVQGLMAVLFLMFLITLFISGKKLAQFTRLEFRSARFQRDFWHSRDLQNLCDYYRSHGALGIEQIFVAGFQEFRQFHIASVRNPQLLVENCRRAMEAANTRVAAQQERWLTLLASFGSTAPYIGLFGTVIGIMNSFISLGGNQQTSIATVAPGIAEALIATAMGLLAAIPSVLAYNHFIAKSERLLVQYDAFIAECANVIQRQLMLAHKRD